MKKSTYQLISRSLQKLSFTPLEKTLVELDPDLEWVDSSQLIVLEDRVLYDAAPFDVDMEAQALAGPEAEMLMLADETVDWAEVVAVGAEQVQQQALETLDFAELLLAEELQAETVPEAPQLVVVDSAVEDYEQLLSELTASGNIEVLHIESNQNGFEQVSKKLADMGNVSAVHVLSHAADGQMTLGNAYLTLESLESYAEDLAGWKSGLSSDADLLFYGCELATEGDGQLLLSHIVDLTDADVAASTDLTGHASLGGDWVLEFESGIVQTEIIVSGLAQEAWVSSLLLAGATGVEAGVDGAVGVEPGITDISTARENRGSTDAVAMDAAGNYVVVWSANTVANGWEVFAQKYDEMGNASGGEITVNQSATGDQMWASVAMDDAGDFVVTWSDLNSGEVMGRYFGVGGLDPGEFSLGSGEDSSVAMNALGQYAFIWEGSAPEDTFGIYASYYDSDHLAIREAFLVNGTVSGGQYNPDIAINSAGEMVAVWDSSQNTYAQRFANDGSHQGFEKFALSGHYDASVELRDDGFYIVGTTNNVGNEGVRAGIFNTSNDLVEYITVNQSLDGDQNDASVALTSDTEFLITWSGPGDQSGEEDASGGVYASRYDFDGTILTTQETEIRVNAYTSGPQANASVAAIATDHYVVVWDGEGDGISDGVFHTLVSPPNQAPTIDNAIAYTTEGIDYVFLALNFGYQDNESDPMTKVLITELPEEGELWLDGSLVTVGQEIDAADIGLGKLVYRQTSPGYGVGFDHFRFQVHDGSQYSGEGEMELDVMSRNVLWLTTQNDVSGATDVTGPDSWQRGDVLEFGGTDLRMGNTTEGSFSLQFQLDTFVDEQMDALHYVTQSVTIGTNSTIVLNAGDIVFSVGSDVFLPGIADIVEDNDIVVFRPTSADYSTGTFELLFDYSSRSGGTQIQDFTDLDALTIVEQRTNFGNTVLEAGDILFVGDLGGPGGQSDSDVYYLTLTDVGQGNSEGTSAKLVDGSDINIREAIDGLELVERTSVAGGYELTGGTLLISVDEGERLGDNEIDVDDTDIVALDVTETDFHGGRTKAQAEIFFDGADVNFDDNTNMDIDGFSLLSFDAVNQSPQIADQSFDVMENTPDGTVLGMVAASDPDVGDSLLYEVVGGSGVGIFDVDPATGDLFVVDGSQLDYESAQSHSLHVSVTDGGGLVETASMTIDILDHPENTLSGHILNDLNANGSLTDDSLTAFENATVHLFEDTNDNGSFDGADTWLASDTTDADGHYQFEVLDNGNFFVVVDSRSLAPVQGYNGTYTVADVWAEQTYASAGSLYFDGVLDQYTSTDGLLFGGRDATVSDDLASFTTMQHVTIVELNDNDASEIDFGFSFNVVTNLEDGTGIDGQTVQGSLRQFIINANSIVGGNEMKFVPAVDANVGGRDTWQIEIMEALPEIKDNGTIINGQALSATNGVSYLDNNSDEIGEPGSFVGVNDFSLALIDRPELELLDGSNVEYGLLVTGDDVLINGLRVEGFGTDGYHGNVVVEGGDRFTLQNSHLLDASDSNLFVGLGADDGTVINNVIESGGRFGIVLDGSSGSVWNWYIAENFILDNAKVYPGGDGIDAQYNTTATIEHNLFNGNYGSAVDTWQNTGEGLFIHENTIFGNGIGGEETSGVRLMGSNHQLLENVIQENEGAGVLVTADGPFSGPSNFNEISQNEFGGNGGVAIDLDEFAMNYGELQTGDGVSDFMIPNLAAGNMGLQSPQLLSSTFDGANTVIEGTAGPNQRIELYMALADADGSDEDTGGAEYGEGIQFIGWTTSDGSGNFSFVTAALGSHQHVSAIAIDGSLNTSEFSANLAVNTIPVTEDFQISVSSGGSYSFETSDFVFSDLDLDAFDGVVISTAPTLGQLFNGVDLVTNGEFVSAVDISNGNLRYEAPGGVEGHLELVYFQVSDGGALSNVHEIDIDATNNDPAITTPREVEIDENDSSLTITGSDPDGDDFTFDIVGGDDEGDFSIDPDSGIVTFSVTPDFENPQDADIGNDYEIVVRVTDVVGNFTDKTITINVEPVNEEAPVVTSPTVYAVVENDPDFNVAVVAEDSDNPTSLSYSVDNDFGDGSLFSIDSDSGLLSMDFIPDYEKPFDQGEDNRYVVRVLVSDGEFTTPHEIVFEIQPENDNAQEITTDVQHDVDEGETDVTQVQTEDDDVDSPRPVTWSVLTDLNDGDHFEIDSVTGDLSFLVSPNYENPTDGNTNNTYVVWVQADDGDGFVVTKRLRIYVRDVNEEINGIALSPDNVNENAPADRTVGFVQVADEDQEDSYAFTLLDDAGGRFAIDPDTGEITVEPNAGLNYEAEQSWEVLVHVVDDAGHDWTQTLTIHVNDVNEAPVAIDLDKDELGTVAEGGVLLIANSQFDPIEDPDGDSLSISIVSGPNVGTVIKNGDGYLYKHDGSEVFTDRIIYKVSDGRGGTDLGVIAITIDPVNDAPTALGERIFQTGEGAMMVAEGVVLANDSDPDSGNLSVIVVQEPATGEFIVKADGSWVFIPDAQTTGFETVQYVVSDGMKVSGVVTAELVIPFQVPVVEDPVADPVDENEPEENPGNPDGPLDQGDPDGEEANDVSDNLIPASNPGRDQFANDISSDNSGDRQSDTNNSLSGNALLNANYGFTYQKSSIDLSQLLSQSENSSLKRFINDVGLDASQLYGSMWEGLDKVNEEMLDNISSATGNIMAAASLTGLATAAFYVVLMTRSGMLVASVVSSMPAWQSFDPLPILQYSAIDNDSDADDDSIESLLDRD